MWRQPWLLHCLHTKPHSHPCPPNSPVSLLVNSISKTNPQCTYFSPMWLSPANSKWPIFLAGPFISLFFLYTHQLQFFFFNFFSSNNVRPIEEHQQHDEAVRTGFTLPLEITEKPSEIHKTKSLRHWAQDTGKQETNEGNLTTALAQCLRRPPSQPRRNPGNA